MRTRRVEFTPKSAAMGPLRVLFFPMALAASAMALAQFLGAQGNLVVTLGLFVAQDRMVAPLFASLIAGTWLLSRWTRFAWATQLSEVNPRRTVWVLAVTGFVSAWLIARFAFHGYALTLDEYVPQFQAEIFRAGRLLAPLPPDLAAFHSKFQPFFVYVDEARELWGSQYRPGHAILLALSPSLGGVSLLNPLLTGLSVWAVGDIARRLCPGWTLAPVLAALLLLVSPQFLVTAGSGFSYPAHLAFNLVWLTLFLRGVATERWGPHIAAALLGAYAIGLHQVHVHPLFAASFLTLLLLGAAGRRMHLLPYVLAYGLALPFWVLWPEIAVWIQSGDASALPRSFAEVDYLREYIGYRHSVGAADAGISGMLLEVNLLRFVLWLSPSLVMLVTVAMLRPRELTAVHFAALAGIGLTVAINHLLIANQEMSWGSRYYHPIIGNLVILALAGADLLRRQGERRILETALLLIFASAVIVVPLRLVQVERIVAPRAMVQAAIESIDADVVTVRPPPWFLPHFVRNSPFLTNRPLIVFETNPVKIADDLPAPLRQARVRELTLADFEAFGLPPITLHEPNLNKN